jgi:hypothetical protein
MDAPAPEAKALVACVLSFLCVIDKPTINTSLVYVANATLLVSSEAAGVGEKLMATITFDLCRAIRLARKS